jgi:hypothetical protein
LRNLDRDYIGSVRESVDEIGEMIYRARRAAPDSAAQPDTTASASGERCACGSHSAEVCARAGLCGPGFKMGWGAVDYSRAAYPVQAGEAVEERALFEAWLRRRWPNAHRPIDEKTATGSYAFTENNLLWEAWQARASLAPVSAQPNDIDMVKGALDLCEPEEQQAFQRIVAALKGERRG